MNIALPESEQEMYDWAEKAQLAVAALATELAEMKYEQSITQSTMKTLDKRQRFTSHDFPTAKKEHKGKRWKGVWT